ncbi:MAG TPA: FAD/NAD(P)-binding oxidoreductase [Povalibacter sp.]|jgi:sulfide:quinone oxidoreductase|nr:FAD/NAD(P)-binding oxidoreductase [Povalibacter sp.]
MATIVVIGAGIGGVPCAYELRKRLPAEHKVALVGSSERFEFTPSNPWIAVGWREPQDVAVDLVERMKKHRIDFHTQLVTSIDAQASKLTLADGTVLAYDYLVIATGPKLMFEEVPGLGPHANTQSVCTQAHAAQAWDRYQAFLADPGPIVVGAAPGASCFGPAYEFAMILDADLRKRKLRDRVPMTFVTSEPYVGHMGLGGVGDSKGLMESELRQRHIQWIANAKITGASDREMQVTELVPNGQSKDHVLPFKYSMVIPAFKGVDAVAAVPGLCNPRGFVLIDEHQRNPKYRNIFSAGVCVAIPPVEVTPVPTGAPKTGYMIESMVSAISENIIAEIEGRSAQARATWNAICLADFGDTGAAFVALPQIPPRNVTWTKLGKWVHVAKIAFEKYFLHKVRSGDIAPVYERYVLKALGIMSLK